MSYRKKKNAPANPRQTALTDINADLQSTEELISTGELYSGQPYQCPVLDRAKVFTAAMETCLPPSTFTAIVTSWTFVVVTFTVCISPVSLSTPMCAL